MIIRSRHMLLSIVAAAFAASAAVYSGRVVDNASPAKPIANVTITLKNAGVETYSDSAGRFSLNTATSVIAASRVKTADVIRISNGRITFETVQRENARGELYTLTGRRVCVLFDADFEAGKHTVALPELLRQRTGSGAYIIVLLKGGVNYYVKIFSIDAQTSLSTGGSGVFGAAPGKSAAAPPDSLLISRKGYVAKGVVAAAQIGDVTLDRDPKEIEIDRKADSIIALMTIEEKAGQMVQAQINFTNVYAGRLKDADIAAKGIGSVFNGGSDQSAIGKGNTAKTWAAAIDRVMGMWLTSQRARGAPARGRRRPTTSK